MALIPGDGASGSGSSDDGARPATGAVTATAPSQPPGIPRLTPEQLQKIVDDDTGVGRDQVERNLTHFLEQLQKAQGGKSLKIDDKVRLAGNPLSKWLGDSELQVYTLLQDDRLNVVPKELAQEVAALLPSKIPCENFDNLLKLKPQRSSRPSSCRSAARSRSC